MNQNTPCPQPRLQVVNRRREAGATAALARRAAQRFEPNHAVRTASILQPIVRHGIGFPASQPGNRMALGHGRPPAACCVVTTSQ